VSAVDVRVLDGGTLRTRRTVPGWPGPRKDAGDPVIEQHIPDELPDDRSDTRPDARVDDRSASGPRYRMVRYDLGPVPLEEYEQHPRGRLVGIGVSPEGGGVQMPGDVLRPDLLKRLLGADDIGQTLCG
jgi:hypothetical protein